MKGKNILLLVGAAALGYVAYEMFIKKDDKKGKDDKKSNAEGTTRTVGPCSGSMATPANCQTYCEDTLGGTYDSAARTCTYSGNAAPGPMFGGMKVITGRKIVRI